jgi:hypothetical protein
VTENPSSPDPGPVPRRADDIKPAPAPYDDQVSYDASDMRAANASEWPQAGAAGAVQTRPPVAPGVQMKRRNPLAVWIGLPLITLGIYHYVWYYKIHREMRDFDRRRPVATVGPLLVVLLLGWTVVAPLISYYRTGDRIVESQRAAGLPATCVPVLGMLLMLVFGLGSLYYQVELNKVVDAYGGSATPPGTNVPLYV